MVETCGVKDLGKKGLEVMVALAVKQVSDKNKESEDLIRISLSDAKTCCLQLPKPEIQSFAKQLLSLSRARLCPKIKLETEVCQMPPKNSRS